MRGTGQPLYPIVAALAGIVMLLRAGSTVWTFNDTRDEPFHMASAIALIEKGRHVQGIETPPLSRIVQGLAMAAAGARLPISYRPDDSIIHYDQNAFAVGDQILGSESYWRLLSVARLANLCFAVVALLYVYLLGRWAGGPVVGALATIFFSTDPTFLAHAPLATVDAAACAGFLVATYHALRWIRCRSSYWPRATIAGAAIGIAIAAKFSALILLPIVFILLAWSYFKTRTGRVTNLLAAAGAMFLTIWACYLFDVGRLSDSEMFTTGPARNQLPKAIVQAPVPMPSLPIGVISIIRHNQRGHAGYLNGEIRQPAESKWWYYFPEALAVKSPGAVIVAIVLSIGLALWRARRKRLSAMIAVVAVVFLAFFMTSKVQIGVRHLLPMIPLLYVLAALQLVRRGWVIVLALLIAGSFIETAARHPDYISFLNFAGRRGYDGKPLLLDSNLDWGQDLARLGRWLHTLPEGTRYETYLFGNPNVAKQPETSFRFNQVTEGRQRLVIVSQNVKCGLYPVKAPVPPEVYKLQPIKRIGESIEVYSLER